MTKTSKTKVDELKDALKKKGKAKAEKKNDQKPSAASDFEGQIRAAEKDAKDHYDKLLNVMAEFENFKKRISKEREGLVKFGNDKLLSDLLPSLDDLDRVLEHVPPEASKDVKSFVEGVELVRKTLLATLAKYDLKEVAALGEVFDPTMHEAISVVDSDSHEPNHVMAVHRKGYWLAGRLLRPALVTVAKA